MPLPACRAILCLVRSGYVAALLLVPVLLPAATTSRSVAAQLPPDPKPSPVSGQSVLSDVAEDVSAADGTQVSIGSDTGRLVQCSSYGGPNWITSNSRVFQIVRTCSLTVPVDGVAYINATATGYLPREEGGWFGSFRLAVDAASATPEGEPRTERSLFLRDNSDLPNDPDSQTSKTMATSLLVPLAAGTHTFSLVARSGIGVVRLLNPAVSVVFVPRTTTDVATCGQGVNTWTATPAENFQSIVSCSLTLPQDGFAFVSATSAVAPAAELYEARFRVGSDTVGVAQSDRYVNVYPALVPVSGETAASSSLIPVRAGANTFHFLGYRYAGSGTMSVSNPFLSVIYFPSSSLSVIACGAAGANLVTVEQPEYTPVVSCQLDVPRDSLAFVEASTTASIGTARSGPAQEYEGRSRIGVDSNEGIVETERRFSTEADAGDGSDRSVAEAVVVPVTRGVHTVSLNVRRSRGTQPARLYTPTLTVLVAGPRDARLLPLIER